MAPDQAVGVGEHPLAFFANAAADQVAENMASHITVPYEQVASVQWSDGLSGQVRNRFAAVLTDAMENNSRARTPHAAKRQEAKRVWTRLVENSARKVVQSTSRLCCEVCKASVARSCVRSWLASPCRPLERPDHLHKLAGKQDICLGEPKAPPVAHGSLAAGDVLVVLLAVRLRGSILDSMAKE